MRRRPNGTLRSVISYAQNAEDVVLDRAFPTGYAGFYVDVGAADPVVDSVTKHFYDCGWHGINIEPVRVNFEALVQARSRDVNLQTAVGEQAGQRQFYELPPEMAGCSTFDCTVAEELRAQGWEVSLRTVEVTTLTAVCEAHVGSKTIDFLKIDVEGAEAEVLAGTDLARFRPRVLVIEATVPNTPVPSSLDWEQSVVDAGYHFVLFDGLNRFYVRDDEAALMDLLSVPANVFDRYVPAAYEKLRDAAQSLAATREELAHSRSQVRDLQTELEATRSALISTIHEARAPTH